MKYLPIVRRGRVVRHARVDDDVYEWAKEHRWYMQTRGKGGKPQVTRYDRSGGKTRNVFLSRLIVGVDSGSVKQTYPLDGDPFNLQRENLAVAGERRRIQHRATARKLGAQDNYIPQLGITPIVKMAGAIAERLAQ